MSRLNKHICRVVFLAVVVSGCVSSGETRREDHTDSRDEPGVEINNPSLPLSDYLRRVPGVIVRGSGNNVKVNIRGVNSFRANTEPLYVVDGQKVGHSYAQVARMVPVAEIDHIRVLKGVEASAGYGLQGGSGVIEITTKRR